MSLLLFIPFFIIIAGISFFPAIFGFISYPDSFSIINFLKVFNDNSTRISIDVSFIYASFSTFITLFVGIRIAYLINGKSDLFRKSIYLLLILIWSIPNFVSIPFFRICSNWISGESVSSSFTAFSTIVLARSWSDIPMMVLLCLAAFKGIPKNLAESIIIDGGTKRELFNEIYLRKALPTALTYAIILFINAIRDVSIPLMITEGRPFISEGFTSNGIAGYTTTLGFMLKNSITGIEKESTIIINSIIVTLIIVFSFLLLKNSEKRKKTTSFFIGVFEMLWFGFPFGLIPLFFSFLTFKFKDKRFLSLYFISSLLLCVFFKTISPVLVIFTVIKIFNNLKSFNKYSKHFIFDRILMYTWIIWSMVILLYLFYVAFVDTFYLPEIDDIVYLSLNNFKTLFGDNFLLNITNSAIIGAGSALIVFLFAAPASYSSFESKKIRNFSDGLVGIAILLTGINTIIPLFLMFENMKIIDSYTSIILTAANKTLPLAYLIIYGSIKNINPHLSEAAKIDGANKLIIYLKVILPLSFPVILVSVFQTFINGWSSFLAPLIFLTDSGKFPVSLRLFDYAGRKSLAYTQWGVFAAGSIISSLIIVISLIPLRKWIIKEHLR